MVNYHTYISEKEKRRFFSLTESRKVGIVDLFICFSENQPPP